MSEKIYCKDCRFYENEKCRLNPPVWVAGYSGSLFPIVRDFDWCGMAERSEDAKPEFVAPDQHNAGYFAVCVIARDELEKMKEENKELKEAKRELLLILKKTCTLYNINAQCQEYVDECKHGLAQSCSVFRTIQKHDGKDGEK